MTFDDIFNGTLPPSPEPARPAPGPQLRDITPELAVAYLRGETASPLPEPPPASPPIEVLPIRARRITEHKL